MAALNFLYVHLIHNNGILIMELIQILFCDTSMYSRINSTKSQLQAQVALASLGWCHESGVCVKACVHKSVCFCSQSSGSASIFLPT
jgi:hypothetical protein